MSSSNTRSTQSCTRTIASGTVLAGQHDNQLKNQNKAPGSRTVLAGQHDNQLKHQNKAPGTGNLPNHSSTDDMDPGANFGLNGGLPSVNPLLDPLLSTV
ncbi:hypothetical protein PCANC_05611 [Puccinia coronata f. sp. avenae]|nr:hypothetical protein PCANC_18953 [Puccinia coronata f. sp. avenae]PLW54485.1 hypothetical protein PCANC_05611 [Puccinia coronata f. sp. avenae]